jgi:hypothetical protein
MDDDTVADKDLTPGGKARSIVFLTILFIMMNTYYLLRFHYGHVLTYNPDV